MITCKVCGHRWSISRSILARLNNNGKTRFIPNIRIIEWLKSKLSKTVNFYRMYIYRWTKGLRLFSSIPSNRCSLWQMENIDFFESSWSWKSYKIRTRRFKEENILTFLFQVIRPSFVLFTRLTFCEERRRRTRLGQAIVLLSNSANSRVTLQT